MKKLFSPSIRYTADEVAHGISLLRYNGGKLQINTSLKSDFIISFSDGIWREGRAPGENVWKGECMLVFPCRPERGTTLNDKQLQNKDIFQEGLSKRMKLWHALTGKESLTLEISCGTYFTGFYEAKNAEEYYNHYSPVLHIRVNHYLDFNRVAKALAVIYGEKRLLMKQKRKRGWTFIYRLGVIDDT